MPVLDALALPLDAIQYYAQNVIRSDIFHVVRRSDEDRYLHLIAFVAHQYRRLQDNLVDILISALQSSVNSAQRTHKELCYGRHDERAEALRSLSTSVQDALIFAESVEHIAADNNLADSEKIRRIRELLATSADRRAADAALQGKVKAISSKPIITPSWKVGRHGSKIVYPPSSRLCPGAVSQGLKR